MTPGMMRLQKVLGHANDLGIADRLHELSHRGSLEFFLIDRGDLGRRRFRFTTDRGTDCAIALPRDQRLEDGSVLYIGQDRAIVVRVAEQRWLRLLPLDEATALRLGYVAGNLHWRVRFKDKELQIALEGPEGVYLERLSDFFSSGTVRRVDETRR
jgi:urease accessory protein